MSRFEDRSITESSGVVVSRQYPGILWTHNDGGSPPAVYATDTLGRDHGAFELVGASNVDWEAMSLGTCGNDQCLYLADVGDNNLVRDHLVMYRIREPALPTAIADSAFPITEFERLAFRYPDEPRNVEAMYADRNGTVYLITKTTRGPPLWYRLSAADWDGHDTTAAEPLGPFPIETGSSRLAGITGADLTSDGSMLVVRTYRELFFYHVDVEGNVGDGPVATCPILGLESQGEGVAWLDDQRVVLTSERGVMGRGTVMIVHCELP